MQHNQPYSFSRRNHPLILQSSVDFKAVHYANRPLHWSAYVEKKADGKVGMKWSTQIVPSTLIGLLLIVVILLSLSMAIVYSNVSKPWPIIIPLIVLSAVQSCIVVLHGFRRIPAAFDLEIDPFRCVLTKIVVTCGGYAISTSYDFPLVVIQCEINGEFGVFQALKLPDEKWLVVSQNIGDIRFWLHSNGLLRDRIIIENVIVE